MSPSPRALSHIAALRILLPFAFLASTAIHAFFHGAAAAPFAYVTHGTDTISVIDTATMALVTTVKFQEGSKLTDIAASPDGKRLWLSDGVHFGSILIVDTANNKVKRTVELPSSSGDFTYPGAIAFAPQGSDVYVADWWSSRVVQFDEHGNAINWTKLGAGVRGPCGLAVAPDGKHVYATDCFAKTVSIIDRAHHNSLARVTVGEWSDSLAVTPDGKYVYVMLGIPEGISVINTADNTIVASIPVENKGFNAIAVSGDGARVYATGTKNQVTIIDATTHGVQARVDVGKEPIGLALTPDGKHAYVADAGSAEVSVIDLSTNHVVATIKTAARPTSIAIPASAH